MCFFLGDNGTYKTEGLDHGGTRHTVDGPVNDGKWDPVHGGCHVPLHHPLDVDQFAARVGLGGRQLTRIFQNNLGGTPARYLVERKFAAAKRALETNEETIKQIAYSLGFKSLQHFSNWFRKESGLSPHEFRKSYEISRQS